MAAQALAKYLHERGIYYGWVVVAITFCFMVGSTASMSMAGVLVPDISREFGWSTGEISGPLGLRFALFGLVAPFAGALMIKYGTRAVVSGSAALMVLGISLALTMTTKLQLWVLAVSKRSEEALLRSDPRVADTGIACGVNPRLDTAQICPRALRASEADNGGLGS
jgi:MFS family permease